MKIQIDGHIQQKKYVKRGLPYLKNVNYFHYKIRFFVTL